MQSDRVTIEDIARRLALSQATVSRALNDKYGVSEKTRKTILLCAYEMGYDFSELHSPPKRKNSAVDCVCVAVKQTDLLDKSFYGDVLYGIETTLKAQKVGLLLSIVNDEKQTRTLLNDKRLRPDGYIIMGRIPFETVLDLHTKGTPMVMLDPFYYDHNHSRIALNNARGGADAAGHLLDYGHKRLCFVGNPAYSGNFTQRYQGFADEVRRRGAQLVDLPPLPTERMLDPEALGSLLQKADRPTGFFCANDGLAFTLYDLAASLGLTIPRDLSVVGFDNVEKAAWVTPRLTSVDVPRHEFGSVAAQVLLDSLLLPSYSVRLVQLETGFVRRESVGPPPPERAP